MKMEKINRIIITSISIIVLLLVFVFHSLYDFSSTEQVKYEYKYHSGDTIEKNNSDYETVYRNSDNSFMGINVEDNILTFPTFVSKQESIDFYPHTETKDFYLEDTSEKVHIYIETRKVQFSLKYYTVFIVVYYDNYFLLNLFRDSQYDDLDFTNEEEIIKKSQEYADMMIQVYKNNEKEINEIFTEKGL